MEEEILMYFADLGEIVTDWYQTGIGEFEVTLQSGKQYVVSLLVRKK